MNVKNIQDYRKLKDKVLSDLVSISKTKSSEIGDISLAIAKELRMSQTGVMNYFRGVGSNTETAFEILEKYKELNK